MTGVTTGQTALTTATDSDDTEVYLTTGLVAALQALANLFESATGHAHNAAGKGAPIGAGGIAAGTITAAMVAAGELPVRIGNVTLGAPAASIDFSTIPATYAHLWLEVYARSDAAVTSHALVMRFNGDAGSDYLYEGMSISGSTVTGSEQLATSSGRVGGVPGASATANLFGQSTIHVDHYANAANHKMWRASAVYQTGGSTGNLFTESWGGRWAVVTAINQVTLLPASGNFVAGSRATLYGLP